MLFCKNSLRGASFMAPFWYSEFWGCCYVFQNLCTHGIDRFRETVQVTCFVTCPLLRPGKMVDRPLLALRVSLFRVFPAPLNVWRPAFLPATWRHICHVKEFTVVIIIIVVFVLVLLFLLVVASCRIVFAKVTIIPIISIQQCEMTQALCVQRYAGRIVLVAAECIMPCSIPHDNFCRAYLWPPIEFKCKSDAGHFWDYRG
jgi:hypothetical protein